MQSISRDFVYKSDRCHELFVQISAATAEMLQRLTSGSVEVPASAGEYLREAELTRRLIEQLASDTVAAGSGSGSGTSGYEETNLDESSPEHRPRQARSDPLSMDAITRIKQLGECLRALMQVLKQHELHESAPAALTAFAHDTPPASIGDFTQV